MGYTFASATILLILILDPLGNIPLFIAALKNVPRHRRVKVILREITIAFFILLLFMFIGNHLLHLLGLSDLALRIGGGIVLFLIAIRMIFSHPEGAFGNDPRSSGEPFIVPLAVPAVAGPSAMATVMLLVSQRPNDLLEWTSALLIATLVSMVVLLLAEKIQQWIGERTVIAFERLMGLVLIVISVEMLLEGIHAFVKML